MKQPDTHKTLYLEPIGGIAGDMMVAALLALGVPLPLLREELDKLEIEGLSISSEKTQRHGIQATRFLVSLTNSENKNAPHDHPPHPHRPYREIKHLLNKSSLPPEAKAKALKIFARLAEAEGKIHGVPPEDVTFHEVGAWDAIADIVCVALGLMHLGVEQIFTATIPLGEGTIRSAHGTMPVPAPATLDLLSGFPVTSGPPAFERTTPTGAAILAALAQPAPEPWVFIPQKTGYGAGTKDDPAVANVLRATLGEVGRAVDSHEAGQTDQANLAETAIANIDDSNPEWLGYLTEKLLAGGAWDVALVPIYMKKNRPGTQLQVLYDPPLREAITRIVFQETTTIGIRYAQNERALLPRRETTVETPWGKVTGKASTFEERTWFSPEYESCRTLAEKTGTPLREIYAAAQKAFDPEKD